MLRTFLEPNLQRLGVETQTLWFQQGGAVAHDASPQQDVPAHVIPRRRNIERTARSPNHNACDFLPRGYLKSKVYGKQTKDNSGLETEHRGQSGSTFSLRAPTSDAKLPEKLVGIC